jgi:cytochrome b
MSATMAAGNTPCDQAVPAPRRVKVWHLPTRLFHGGLILAVSTAWASGSLGCMELHFLAGYAILALLLFRLGWGFVGSATARFGGFVRGPGAVLAYARSLRRPGARTDKALELGHNPAGGWMVVALLLVLALQAGTGLFTSDDVTVDGPAVKLAGGAAVALASTIHRHIADVILAMVGLHVAAILAYRLLRGEDLVTPMLTGRKTVAADVAVEAPRMAPAARAALVLLLATGLVGLGLYVLG